MVSLGWNAWKTNGHIAVILWCLAALWGIASVVAWQRERLTLKHRVIQVANRVRHCLPNWWKSPYYREHSSYGNEASLEKYLAETEAHEQRWLSRIRHPKRRYTERLHRQVVWAIEEMGRCGLQEPFLKRFLSNLPDSGEYENLARELWSKANKLT